MRSLPFSYIEDRPSVLLMQSNVRYNESVEQTSSKKTGDMISNIEIDNSCGSMRCDGNKSNLVICQAPF